METLIVFLIIFLPVGWLIWRMIRYTRDTIGSNSPMKVQRIYRTTMQSFFVRSDYLFVLMGLIMFGVTMHAVFFARFSTPYPEIGRAVVFLLSLSSLAVPMPPVIGPCCRRPEKFATSPLCTSGSAVSGPC